LKAEQDERKRLESIIRGLKKETGHRKPAKTPPKLLPSTAAGPLATPSEE